MRADCAPTRRGRARSCRARITRSILTHETCAHRRTPDSGCSASDLLVGDGKHALVDERCAVREGPRGRPEAACRHRVADGRERDVLVGVGTNARRSSSGTNTQTIGDAGRRSPAGKGVPSARPEVRETKKPNRARNRRRPQAQRRRRATPPRAPRRAPCPRAAGRAHATVTRRGEEEGSRRDTGWRRSPRARRAPRGRPTSPCSPSGSRRTWEWKKKQVVGSVKRRWQGHAHTDRSRALKAPRVRME